MRVQGTAVMPQSEHILLDCSHSRVRDEGWTIVKHHDCPTLQLSLSFNPHHDQVRCVQKGFGTFADCSACDFRSACLNRGTRVRMIGRVER